MRHPALSRFGAIMVAVAFWLTTFCSQCPASELPVTDSMPASHCQSGMLQQDSGQHGKQCEHHCGSHLASLQSQFSLVAATVYHPLPDPVPAITAEEVRTTAVRAQTPATAYAGPERSSLPPFQRYTVLLN